MPIKLNSTGGGSITLDAPNTASDYTLTFPAQNGTPITTQPSTAGNVLTSDGTNWVSQAPAATGVPSGGIVYHPSQTTLSGYLKCDGSIYNKSAYPDLATATGTPLLLGSELLATSYTASFSTYGYIYISSANGVGFAAYTGSSTGSVVANGMITSTDGVTWTARSAVVPGFYNSNTEVVYINSTYLVPSYYWTWGGSGRTYQTSTDLSTWTARTASTGSNSGYPAYFVGNTTLGRAITVQGTTTNPTSCCPTINSYVCYYTSDGINWSAASGYPSTTALSPPRPVAGSNGFVAINSTQVWYSANGSTWSNITSNIQSTIPAATTFYNVFWNGSYYYVISNGGILRSSTGASGSWSVTTAWSGTPANSTLGLYRLLTANGVYLLASDYTNNVPAYVSNDMVTWYAVNNSYQYAGVAGSNFIGMNGSLGTSRTIYYMASAAYNTSTQFPVPNATQLAVTAPSYNPRPYAFIKT